MCDDVCAVSDPHFRFIGLFVMTLLDRDEERELLLGF